MSPEERDLITGLFDRMRSYGRPEKDMQAETLIVQSMRQNPDAGYMLVQSVLVQDQAMQQADERIKELEARNAELEDYFARSQPQQPQQSSGGGFLGGLFGGGKSAAPAAQAPRGITSVPPSTRPWGQPQQPQAQQPWGNRPTGQDTAAQAQPAQRAAGGGFMKTAMATAAGVAGGMILADSIRGMMGGSGGAASAKTPGAEGGTGSEWDSASSSSQPGGYQDAGNNDPGTFDNSAPTGNFDGADFPSDGGGGGGFDVDI